jgi:hypothetical protein
MSNSTSCLRIGSVGNTVKCNPKVISKGVRSSGKQNTKPYIFWSQGGRRLAVLWRWCLCHTCNTECCQKLQVISRRLFKTLICLHTRVSDCLGCCQYLIRHPRRNDGLLTLTVYFLWSTGYSYSSAFCCRQLGTKIDCGLRASERTLFAPEVPTYILSKTPIDF